MGVEWDVFFSYRRKDLGRAKPLLAALNEAGVRVWRDETDLPEFAPITREIREAIARSKALVAFYSADYSLSRACFEEITSAWIAAQQAGESPHLRVLIVNPEPAFDHIPAVLAEQQSLRWPGDDLTSFAALAGKIRAHLNRLTGTLVHAGLLAQLNYHGMAAISTLRFVGRVRELWELHGQLTANRMSIISGVWGQVTAQVRGMGGSGKSMLAREY